MICKIRDCICYHLVLWLPFASRWPFYQIELALLPYAGLWAYRGEPGARY